MGDERGAEQRPPAVLPDDAVTLLDIHGSLFYAGARALEASLPDPTDVHAPVVVLRMRGRVTIDAAVCRRRYHHIGVMRSSCCIVTLSNTPSSHGKDAPMATLTAVKFPSVGGAQAVLSTLEGLQSQQLITVLDAAIVQWPEGRKKPKTQQLHNTTGAGALSGTFWGMLFGLLFFVPFLGAAIGAAMGALAGSMTDVGIDDDFIKQCRAEITPGTSALFLLSTDAVTDRVMDALRGTEMDLIATNLSAEDEQKLREAFAEE